MIEWLARQGITVGFSDEDTVLAAWLTNGFALDKTIASRAEGLDDEECKTVGTRENAQRKIKVRILMSCALCVGELIPIGTSSYQCVYPHRFLFGLRGDRTSSEGDTGLAVRIDPRVHGL